MTVQFENEAIRRARIVNLANGLLRNRFGYTPKSRALKGPSFWAKAVLQREMRNTSWVKQARKSRNQIEFRLDQSLPEQIVDLPKAAERDDADERCGAARGFTPGRCVLRSSSSSTGTGAPSPAIGMRCGGEDRQRHSSTAAGLPPGMAPLPAGPTCSRCLRPSGSAPPVKLPFVCR